MAANLACRVFMQKIPAFKNMDGNTFYKKDEL
jgi:hypothetical protein